MTPSFTKDAPPASPQPVIGYIRLSKEREDSTSVKKQRQILERYAAAHNLLLIDVQEDIDVSASKKRLNRPGLTEVRRAIRAGEATAVLVWRMDRLARSVVDFGTLLDEGLHIISCTEPLDTTTPMGRAMAEVLQVFAALESRTTGERILSSIAYRVSQGDRWRGGPTPYGYRSVPHLSGDGRTLQVDADEARYIRQAADMVLGGASLYAAMNVLRDSGSRPRRADEWSLSSMRVVLIGNSVLGRQSRHGQPIRDENGLIQTPWEPILTVAEVERLRALLAPTKLAYTRRKASRLLSGVLVCAACGTKLRINSRRSSGGPKIESYGCRANVDGQRCKSPASINADQIEAYITDAFLGVFGKLQIVERRETIRDNVGLAEIQEAIAHTTDAMRIPGADLSALAERLSALVASRDDLAALPSVPTVELVELGETYGERWATSTVDGQRRMLADALTGRIAVHAIGRGHRGISEERVNVPWRWITGDSATIQVDWIDESDDLSADKAVWIIDRAEEALALEDADSTDADVLQLRDLLATFRSGDTSAARPLADLLRLDVRITPTELEATA
ncbi:recombinase family protein [Microbacterium sp. A93]|uniref:recombinase family protein n=1 Tax=Microbacterium sp. A93 TaxID=3450716 RepID=UPI003F4350DA